MDGQTSWISGVWDEMFYGSQSISLGDFLAKWQGVLHIYIYIKLLSRVVFENSK